MRNTSEHLSDWILEQYAEGVLPQDEQAPVVQHIEECGRCAAELDGYRALFEALGELPRFAPSPAFNDAVMARVKVAPAPSPVVVWVTQRLPSTTGGWSLLLAALMVPALPIMSLIAWVMSQPLVSRQSIWQWTSGQTVQAAQAVLTTIMDWGMGSGLYQWARAVYTLALNIPPSTLTAGLIVLAIGIPLSTWSLVRLVQPPLENANYAR